MAKIQSNTFSIIELRQMILAVEVLREIRKDEDATLTFKAERHAEYLKIDQRLVEITEKLEAFLVSDEIEKQTKEALGQQRPEEHVADGS